MKDHKSTISLLLSAFAIVFSVVSVAAPKTGMVRQEEKDVQYVMYIGTNDKDTNVPVYPPEEAKRLVDDILIRHFGGYTVQDADGGWIDDDGTVYQEYSIVAHISDTTPEAVHAAADELLAALHQSSILIQENETKTDFYASPEDEGTAAGSRTSQEAAEADAVTAEADGTNVAVPDAAGVDAAAPETAPGMTASADETAENATAEGNGGQAPAEGSRLADTWTQGSAAMQEINAFLDAVTEEASADYIPVEDRIAVFDLDGTLMCETCPWCFEYMVFADYALHSGDDGITQEMKDVAQEILDSAWGEKPEGMSTRQAAAGALAYEGLRPEELVEIAKTFRTKEVDGFSSMTWEEAYYQPMRELLEVLQENAFTVYIVTATERNVVRGIIEGALGLPPSHVIGTEYGYAATGQGEEADADYTFASTDAVVFDGSYAGENAKTSKVDAIVREIGQQPVLAFGNSSGDVAMMMYTITDNPYKSAAYMVMADDEQREYGDAEEAAEKAASYRESGFSIISMKDDFATIYGEGVEKTR